MCAIIQVQKARVRRHRNGETHESRVRPLPDYPTARCVGLRYINVNQSQIAEEMLDYAFYKAIRGGGLLVFSLRPSFLLIANGWEFVLHR